MRTPLMIALIGLASTCLGTDPKASPPPPIAGIWKLESRVSKAEAGKTIEQSYMIFTSGGYWYYLPWGGDDVKAYKLEKDGTLLTDLPFQPDFKLVAIGKIFINGDTLVWRDNGGDNKNFSVFRRVSRDTDPAKFPLKDLKHITIQQPKDG